MSFTLFLGGCIRQGKAYKKSSSLNSKKALNISVLEGVVIPFGGVIEQEVTEHSKLKNSADAIFYVHFPECLVDFLTTYYKNMMEQSGWTLQKEFNTRDLLLLNFFSVSRICLICICKCSRRLHYTKKVILCIGERSL